MAHVELLWLIIQCDVTEIVVTYTWELVPSFQWNSIGSPNNLLDIPVEFQCFNGI